ncbi:hypothetical protein GPJ56_010547 [Histomonas meleagridis]|uniref:uncharacterized protein n=1 Tax=Histomonas meleagridis TaxID=135588 RepID=UPI0035596856|nr:hypothetical protein GPJ56_010547 [Histomonas meleagridis]KAH0797995.1 hypothetical protein GO595_009214 [Histomonas meleagridis]
MILCYLLVQFCSCKGICVANSADLCSSVTADYVPITQFSQSSLTGYTKLYVNGNISSVIVDASILEDKLDIIGLTPESIVSLKFSNSSLKDKKLEIINITVEVHSAEIYKSELILENVVLKPINGALKIFSDELVSDTNSIIGVSHIEVCKFELTNIDANLSTDLTINFRFSLSKSNSIKIAKEITADLNLLISRLRLDVTPVGCEHKIIFNSTFVRPKVKFSGIKNHVTVSHEGWFTYLEMWEYEFKLSGGTLSFPTDTWPLTLTNLGDDDDDDDELFFEIKQSHKSTIEIGAQNIPAYIINDCKEPLDIVVTSPNAGITGRIEVATANDMIRSTLQEPITFTTSSIHGESNAKINANTNSTLTLHLRFESSSKHIANNINTIYDYIEIEDEVKYLKNFNLASNGHLQVEVSIEDDGEFQYGRLTTDSAIIPESGTKYNMDLKFDIEVSTSDFEMIKSKLDIPMNVVCSKQSIERDSWVLNYVTEEEEENDDDYYEYEEYEDEEDKFARMFSEVTELRYGTDKNQSCVQLVFISLPPSIAEKYCVGGKCDQGYVTIDMQTMSAIQNKVHKGTKKIDLQINENMTQQYSIQLPNLLNKEAAVTISSKTKSQVNVDMDLTIKDHCSSLSVTNSILNFNIKNSPVDNYTEVNVPTLSIYQSTIIGQLKDQISFTGKKVYLDLQTYQELHNSKYGNLTVEFDQTVSDITITSTGINANGVLISKDKVAGTLGTKFTSMNPINLILNSTTTIPGFKVDVSPIGNNSVINFVGNWESLQNVNDSVIVIKHAGNVTINNITSNLNISLEGTGNVIINLKDGQKKLVVENPMKVSGNVTFDINGEVEFNEIQFSSRAQFKLNSASTTTTIESNEVKAKDVVVRTTASVGGSINSNDVVMKSGTSLVVDTININGNKIIFNYHIGTIPRIETKALISKPKQIIMNYETKDGNIDLNNYIGTTNEIYCTDNTTFTLETCESYLGLITFQATEKDLNGENSVLKAYCSNNADTLNTKVMTCINVNLTAAPEISGGGSSGSKTAIIVGCVIVAVVVVAIIVGVIVYKKKKGTGDYKSYNTIG